MTFELELVEDCFDSGEHLNGRLSALREHGICVRFTKLGVTGDEHRRYEVPLRLKFADDAREATEYKIDVAPLEQVDRLFIALSCLHSIAAHLQHEFSNGQDLVISIDTKYGLLALRRRHLLFSKVSAFTWLRSPPGAPTSQNILLHIERLQHIRNLELRSDLAQLIHQNRLLQLAREGAATTPQHLARFDDPRRYGTLVAVLLEASSTLTDEILDLHDRFVGSIFNKARRRRDEAFQSSGKAINEKVRLYARIGQALLAAKEDGADPFAAIEKIVSWVDFARTVFEAEQLAQPEDFVPLLLKESESQHSRIDVVVMSPT